MGKVFLGLIEAAEKHFNQATTLIDLWKRIILTRREIEIVLRFTVLLP